MGKFTLVLAIVVTLLASGCATIVTGASQPVTLNTDPDGATCEVSREAKAIARINTPGQVSLEKAWGALDIACRKAGHHPTELRVDSEVQGWVFGNILIGGLIGLAVDAASGAIRQYPSFITLTLVPSEFESSEEQSRYVNERLERFEAEAAKATELLEKSCSGHSCAQDRKALEEAKQQRVNLLLERVNKARIRSPGT